MTGTPAIVCLSLPRTFHPGLNRATELLRLAYPQSPDEDLLELIFVAGICATIDRFTTLAGPRPRIELPAGTR